MEKKQLSDKRLHLITINFVLIAFMLGCNEFMVVGNLSLIASSFNVSLASISVLVSVFAWTYAILTPIITALTNKINRFTLLIVLLIIFMLGTLLTFAAPSYGWLVAGRILTASVAGVIESLMQAIAYQIANTQKQQSSMVSWVYTGFSVASILGLPIGTFIAEIWSWHISFLMVAVCTLVATIITAILVPKKIPYHGSGLKGQLIIFKDRRIWLGVVFCICVGATLYGYYTYIRELITQSLGLGSFLTVILLAMGILNLLGTQWGGHLAEHDGMKRCLPYYFGMALILVFFPVLLKNSWSGLLMLSAFAVLTALAASPAQIFFLNLATQEYPTAVSLTSSLNAVAYNIGVAIASLTAGQFLKVWGLGSLGYNSLIYCLIAIAALLLLGKIKNK